MSLECPHRPVCPISVSQWTCIKRTEVELAVKRGKMDRLSAERFLAKYGQPMTPASRVYVGQKPARESLFTSLFREDGE